jgi:hypothetical protein
MGFITLFGSSGAGLNRRHVRPDRVLPEVPEDRKKDNLRFPLHDLRLGYPQGYGHTARLGCYILHPVQCLRG